MLYTMKTHNNYMGLITFLDPLSAGTVFRRENLTSKDDPRTERVIILQIALDP